MTKLRMDVLLYAADWVSASNFDAERLRTDDAHVGALTLAAADLEHLSVLAPPRAALVSYLADSLMVVPPQWAALKTDSPFAQWLGLASLAEHWGALRLASLMLHQLERVARSGPHEGAVDVQGQDMRDHIALCWSRQGRIARTMGRLDDAAVWYQQAKRLVARSSWRDARPQAILGLAALALTRGNLPEVERLVRPLLHRAEPLPTLYLLPAHHFMAVAKRRRRQFLDALLHAWAAFDLLDTVDFRREQLVGTMADIALEAGDVDAAARGFEVVLTSNVGPLVRVPALYGAIRARLGQLRSEAGKDLEPHAAMPWSEHDAALTQFAQQLRALQRDLLAPTEAVLIHLADAEIAQAMGAVDQAEGALAAAELLATDAGLFDRQFQVASMRARLREATVAARGIILSVTPTRAATRARHPALHRLLQLR